MLEKPHTFIQPTAPDKPAKERERMREGENKEWNVNALPPQALDTVIWHVHNTPRDFCQTCISQVPLWPRRTLKYISRASLTLFSAQHGITFWVGFPLPAPKAIRICPENPEKFFISSITNENAFSYFVRSLFQVLLTRYWLLYCIYKPNVKRNHKK